MTFGDTRGISITPLGFWPNAHTVSYQHLTSWTHCGLSEEKWVKHLMEIGHVKSIITVLFRDVSANVKTSMIRRALRGRQIDVMKVCGGSWTYPIEDLVSLSIPAKRSVYETSAFSSKQSLQQMLLSNADLLRMECNGPPTVDVDDLLVSNASHLTLASSHLTSRHIYRFLQLWMNGSNPRLRSLKIEGRTANIDPDDTMRNIPYEYITEREFIDKVRANHYPLDNFRPVPKNGVNITGKRGEKATISFVIMRHRRMASFHFFVWN